MVRQLKVGENVSSVPPKSEVLGTLGLWDQHLQPCSDCCGSLQGL